MSRSELVALILSNTQRTNDVRDWPADEQDMHRHGDWPSFTHRNQALDRYRAEKALDAVLSYIGVSDHECDTGHFDRTICPEPCGMMHSYCATCGKRQDPCGWEDASPLLCTPYCRQPCSQACEPREGDSHD